MFKKDKKVQEEVQVFANTFIPFHVYINMYDGIEYYMLGYKEDTREYVIRDEHKIIYLDSKQLADLMNQASEIRYFK